MRKKITVLSFACLLFLAYFEVQAQTKDSVIEGISLDRLKRYENYIKEEIREGKIPGAVSLIMRNGVVVHKEAYGYSNIEEQKPMDTNAIFSIQSMTKAVNSVAIMMLYEEGKFQLNDPVSMYIPAFKNLRVIKDPKDGKKGETVELETEITIFNLLTHTAGFGYGPFGEGNKLDYDYLEVWKEPNSQINIASRVDEYLQLPLMNQPGKEWRYSIANDILSALIEKFSGMTTRDFFMERIFKPLEMYETDYNVLDDEQSRIVQLYAYSEEDRLVATPHNTPFSGNRIWQGKSGLYSTISDFGNFCEMLLNDGEWNGVRILSRKTVELMTSNQTGDLFGWPGYGFGLGFAVLDDLAASKDLGSEGLFYWVGAYNTHSSIDPKEKLVVLFFTQSQPFDLNYHHKMLQLVYQAIVD